MKEGIWQLVIEYWKESSPRRKRLLAVGASFLLFICISTAGVLTPMSAQDAQSRNNDLEQTQQDVQNMPLASGALYIFRNNFVISLLTFIPFAGPFFGAFVMYNTGLIIGAQTTVTSPNVSPVLVLFFLFLFPFTWMEFIAYSAAFSESIWLAWSIIKRKPRNELVNALIVLLFCLGILLAAAFIEMALIKALLRGLHGGT